MYEIAGKSIYKKENILLKHTLIKDTESVSVNGYDLVGPAWLNDGHRAWEAMLYWK